MFENTLMKEERKYLFSSSLLFSSLLRDHREVLLSQSRRTTMQLVGRIEIEVLGIPRPQGSMKAMLNRSTGRPFVKYSDTTIEWRRMITVAAMAARPDGPPLEGPVSLACTFDMPRPKSHYGTGRNAGTLKASAPGRHHAQTPDADKLLRAVGDGITDAGTVWNDDGQVAVITVEKRWCSDGTVPGVTIEVAAL